MALKYALFGTADRSLNCSALVLPEDDVKIDEFLGNYVRRWEIPHELDLNKFGATLTPLPLADPDREGSYFTYATLMVRLLEEQLHPKQIQYVLEYAKVILSQPLQVQSSSVATDICRKVWNTEPSNIPGNGKYCSMGITQAKQQLQVDVATTFKIYSNPDPCLIVYVLRVEKALGGSWCILSDTSVNFVTGCPNPPFPAFIVDGAYLGGVVEVGRPLILRRYEIVHIDSTYVLCVISCSYSYFVTFPDYVAFAAAQYSTVVQNCLEIFKNEDVWEACSKRSIDYPSYAERQQANNHYISVLNVTDRLATLPV